MPNRDSKTDEWSPVVGEDTQRKEDEARAEREEGKTFREIGEDLGVSASRAFEYNKELEED
jgi:hypothetical protein